MKQKYKQTLKMSGEYSDSSQTWRRGVKTGFGGHFNVTAECRTNFIRKCRLFHRFC